MLLQSYLLFPVLNRKTIFSKKYSYFLRLLFAFTKIFVFNDDQITEGENFFSYQYFPFLEGFLLFHWYDFFFLEAYLFKNVCQTEIFETVYLPKECLLNKQSASLCEVSKTCIQKIMSFKLNVLFTGCLGCMVPGLQPPYPASGPRSSVPRKS